jgi:hypothetical protein
MPVAHVWHSFAPTVVLGRMRGWPMQLLDATVCSVFAAFFVWLVVRLINRREQWAKRAAVGTRQYSVELLVAHFHAVGHAC